MSVAPAWYPRPPLSVEQYAALPEDLGVRFELQEGNLVVSPRPTRRHQKFLSRLFVELDRQAPDWVDVVVDVDVDLGLTAPGRPGFVRAPDLIASTAEGAARVYAEGGFQRAAEVVLAVEVLSPGSRRTDSVIKLGEYADAGIPHYWIVDLDDGPSLQALRLVDGAYREVETFGDAVQLVEPFPVRLTLSALLA